MQEESDIINFQYHTETQNMALINKQNGNSGLERSYCKIWFQEPKHVFNFKASSFWSNYSVTTRNSAESFTSALYVNGY